MKENIVFQSEGGHNSYVNALSVDEQSCWMGGSSVCVRLSIRKGYLLHKEESISGLNLIKAEGKEQSTGSAVLVAVPPGSACCVVKAGAQQGAVPMTPLSPGSLLAPHWAFPQPWQCSHMAVCGVRVQSWV